jgi:hypothetical protein
MELHLEYIGYGEKVEAVQNENELDALREKKEILSERGVLTGTWKDLEAAVRRG